MKDTVSGTERGIPGTDPAPGTGRRQVEDLSRLRRPGSVTVAGALIAVLIAAAAVDASELSIGAVLTGLPNIADFVSRMFPPDLSELGVAVALMGETLGIAVTGTLIGVLLAIPCALLAARTVHPNPWVRQPTRLVINMVRAVPELMWALLFVSAVGLGAMAGTLAIIVGTTAGTARLFADIFEASDMRAWEAAAAAGARKSQRISWVLLPQQIPTLASYGLLVLDGNIRAASLLGLVGAGGIGLELNTQLRLFDYGAVLTIVLVVLVVVVTLDQISSALRKRLV